MKKIYLLLTFLITLCLTAKAENPEIERLMQEGIELHSMGEFERAIEKYNEILRIDSTNISAIYEIALSYLALSNYENTILFSTKVINSCDQALSIGAYAIKSEALAALNRTEEAIALLERALDIKGSEYLLLFNLALNYYKLNDIENTLTHVRKVIDLNKTHADAFLLYAYMLYDKELWVRSIFAFQMYLLLEPDDHRSRTAFEELLHIMRITSRSENETERLVLANPPLTTINGVNRFQVYNTINTVLHSLRENSEEESDLFLEFKNVNRAIILLLNEKNDGSEERMSKFWTFYVPFFTRIVESEHYEAFARYISVSYFPESFEWWQENPEYAENFVIWFEEGDKYEYEEEYEYYEYRYETYEVFDYQPPVYVPVIIQQERPNFFQRITSNLRTQQVEENNRVIITEDYIENEEVNQPNFFQRITSNLRTQQVEEDNRVIMTEDYIENEGENQPNFFQRITSNLRTPQVEEDNSVEIGVDNENNEKEPAEWWRIWRR